MDNESDELIQRTIKDNFASCTVLIMASRLNQVMDMDKLLVMSAGRVLEFDTPLKLLDNPLSHFSSLVAQSEVDREQLREVAVGSTRNFDCRESAASAPMPKSLEDVFRSKVE